MSPTTTTKLVLQVRGTDRTFTFDLADVEKIVLGRRCPFTGLAPEVDLDAYGALDRGVSRKHAAILQKQGQLGIVDLGSQNGTYLNGQRLIPQRVYFLNDGDDTYVWDILSYRLASKAKKNFQRTKPRVALHSSTILYPCDVTSRCQGDPLAAFVLPTD